MNNNAIATDSKLRSMLIGAGAVACLVTMAYGFFVLEQDASTDGDNLQAANEIHLLSRQITASAWQTRAGDEVTFSELAVQVERFDEQKSLIKSKPLAEELSRLDVTWQPIKRAAQTLVEAGPRIVFVHKAAQQLAADVRPMQRELSVVADSLRGSGANAATVAAAQKTLWLSERIARNLERIVAGDAASQEAADEFRTDSAELLRIVEALTRGDTLVGINRISDDRAIESMSAAFRRFSTISTSVDRIAGSAAELRQAATARDLILSSDDALGAAVVALVGAVDKMALGGFDQRATLTALFVAPGVLALGLLLILYTGQRRRQRYTQEGVQLINEALRKVGHGDLTVKLADDNAVVGTVARQINTSTNHQRGMVQNVLGPFELAEEEINKIGISARNLVEKGKELTLSVGESMTAATEMVRTSEEIKTSTAEAARTSDRNCQQVAQGYELTKDMSKASVDVRESVQETSKSAKRQGELIQSVTAAAEYIQALNTKISVVAINTRIEAEKAGEYGRPFLGIAEAIADLLREAGEEGRKIISEVRMLQNMSAENLASMENTVGTVVTILEYIERLDSSLEEINSGSAAISSIIRSVDDAAGQSAVSALHMNSSMAQIRERNVQIGKFSEATRTGVAKLQLSMRDAAESLGQFRIDSKGARQSLAQPADVEELEPIGAAPRLYREEDMSALESAQKVRVSV